MLLYALDLFGEELTPSVRNGIVSISEEWGLT